MRLGDIVSVLRKSSVWAPAALLGGLLALGGCETKGLIDPGEMMRAGNNKGRLVVPVLESIGGGLDEMEPAFRDAEDIRQADLKASTADYVIGRNDLLSISISELAGIAGVETVKTSRVSESGTVSLPLIGTVKAAGLTEAELEKAIARMYREQNLIQQAQVSVTVIEARQRTFSVLGAVQRPGQYQIVQSDFRMFDALTIAGGMTVQGIEYAYILRKDPKPEDTTRPTDTGTKPGDPLTTPRVKPVDPLEKKPQSRVPSPNELTRVARATYVGPPVHLTLLQDPSGTGAPKPADVGTEKQMLIGGKWVDVKSPAAPATGTAPVVPVKVDAPVVPPAVAPAVAPTVPPVVVPEVRVADAPVAGGTGSGGTSMGGTGAGGPGSKFEFEGLKAETDTRIIRVPVSQLLNGQLQYNVVIRANDTIIFPEPKVGEYYMSGHVLRTGVYSLTGRQITLKQAIASAGMIDPLGWPERTEVIRRIDKNRELFVRVDLPKIFAGEQPDMYLRPYDVVNVGTNAVAPFLAAIRGAFRFTYGFGFIYDRNFYDQNGTQR